MAQYAFISWLFKDNSGFNIIYSFTYFNKIIHNIEFYLALFLLKYAVHI